MNELSIKILRIMLILAAFSADKEDSIIRPDILTSVTYAEAVRDSTWEEMWKNIIHVKLTVLTANETWEETVPPRRVNIVISKWVFKLKLNTDRFLNKLKARLVARGFSQIYSVDYENTFALTVKFNTLWVFLTIVALKNLEWHQVNVNNIFMKFFLKKTIYIALSSEVNVAPNCVLHILRSLYGLKQATQDWHEQCVIKLLKLNFHQSKTDLCLLLHSIKRIMLLLYVNNIVMTSANLPHILWFKQALVSVFKVKNLRETQKILDIWVTHNHKMRTLCLNQIHYVNKVLKNLHMWPDKHRVISISLNRYDVLHLADLTDQRID